MQIAHQGHYLGSGENPKLASPLLSSGFLLLEADFFGHADHETGLDLDYLIVLVLGDHLVTRIAAGIVLFQIFFGLHLLLR